MDFRILGQLEAVDNGEPVALGSPQQRALLARLLISANEVVATDRLIEDLWRGEPPDTARHTLHVYISRLRKVIDADHTRLQHEGQGYRLTVAPDEFDAIRFERVAADGRGALARDDPATAATLLQEALSAWRGAALTDVADEAYARAEVTRLEDLRLATIEQRLWADLELGRHDEVVEELGDLVAQYPLREILWEQLMLALYRCGRQAEALRVYQTARSNLAGELGIEPGPALRRLEQQILSQDPELEQAPRPETDTIPSELPLQRTSFVGRERELAQAAVLLRRSRLLTLTGAPGSGKTRLALRLAAGAGSEYPHGTFFVPLAAVSDPKHLDAAVARALGLGEVKDEPALVGIQTYLRKRRVLLVVDNFEHILGAAPQVGGLLDTAPDLTILVTSRSSLGLSGEQEYAVPPLELPRLQDESNLEELGACDSVHLFVTRAQSTDPDFQLTPDNADAIGQMTIRLEGLPLAIELAAARIKALTPRELVERLERRLSVLTEGPTDSASRHRTMRDCIAWSYELLSPGEQETFCRLGVLLDGFTLEAAGAVTGLAESETLHRVSSLLDKSLLYRPVHVGPARYAMLEMIREFAVEQLAETGDGRQVAELHAHYFLRLAEHVEPQLTSDPGGVSAKTLAPEVGNIRRAVAFFLEAGDPDLGLGLAASIWRFWQSSDQLVEGREWLDQLLAHPGATASPRAEGLAAAAGLAYWQADYDGALAYYGEALAIHREAGDRSNEADTLCNMSLTALWKKDVDAGEQLAREASAIYAEVGSQKNAGLLLMARASVLYRKHEYAAARQLWLECLELARESGDQALALTQLVGLAAMTFLLGDLPGAMEIALGGIDEALEAQNIHMVVWMLDLVATFGVPVSPKAAVRLAGAADSLRREGGGGMVVESLEFDDARSAAADVLSPTEIARAWADGKAMSLEESVAEAHELGKVVASPQQADTGVEQSVSDR